MTEIFKTTELMKEGEQKSALQEGLMVVGFCLEWSTTYDVMNLSVGFKTL